MPNISKVILTTFPNQNIVFQLIISKQKENKKFQKIINSYKYV